ncbi:MAG: C-type lectin domain-containing protein [Myxococcales bacterium]|nr:C-type lectin domain-containing protein [Myxococcales bacterium]
MTLSRCTFVLCFASLLAACGQNASQPEVEEPSKPPPPSNATSPATDRCAPNAASYGTNGDTTYYRFSSGKSWSAAKADCEAMGGRLAVPMDSAGNSAIRSTNGGPNLWIGLSQQSGQSNPSAGWVDVESKSLGYSAWRGGEPNDYPTAGEQGQEDCAMMYASDGTWNDDICGNSKHYVCEFGIAPVSCGGGASCTLPSGGSSYKCSCPAGQTYDKANNTCYGGALAVEINSLKATPASGDIFVNHPFSVRVGFKGTGNTNQVELQVGLMQRPPSGAAATNTELATLKSCIVATKQVNVLGSGTQQFADITGVVPPECLEMDSSRVVNLMVVVDPVQDTTTQGDDNKWTIYNVKNASDPLHQKCRTPDPGTGTPGCVIDLTVRPSPGLDLALASATPGSSVVVLPPAGTSPNLRPGGSERPKPMVTVESSVIAYGRDRDTAGAATMPGNVSFRFDIIALPDTSGVGWKPLSVDPEGNHAPLSALVPGEELQRDAALFPTPEFRTLTSSGGAWAGISSFQIRECLNVPFTEVGPSWGGGPAGTANNCKTFSVQMVAGQYPAHSASSYTIEEPISESFGSSSTLGLSLSGGTKSYFDTSGAYTDNDIKATMKGFFGSFDVFEAWGDADAVRSTAKADLDYGLKVFGVSLISDATSAAASVSYNKDLSYSKSICYTYTYGAIVSVELEGCFAAAAGLDMTLTASSTSISGNVRPYISATLSVEASLNVVIYRLSLTGSVTLLGINTTDGDGVTATLSYSVPSLSPLKLTIGFDISANLRLTTLDGSLTLEIEQLEANVCYKKKWGIKWYYPCYSYDTVYEATIFSYDGYAKNWALLDEVGSSITIQ